MRRLQVGEDCRGSGWRLVADHDLLLVLDEGVMLVAPLLLPDDLVVAVVVVIVVIDRIDRIGADVAEATGTPTWMLTLTLAEAWVEPMAATEASAAAAMRALRIMVRFTLIALA